MRPWLHMATVSKNFTKHAIAQYPLRLQWYKNSCRCVFSWQCQNCIMHQNRYRRSEVTPKRRLKGCEQTLWWLNFRQFHCSGRNPQKLQSFRLNGRFSIRQRLMSYVETFSFTSLLHSNFAISSARLMTQFSHECDGATVEINTLSTLVIWQSMAQCLLFHFQFMKHTISWTF